MNNEKKNTTVIVIFIVLIGVGIALTVNSTSSQEEKENISGNESMMKKEAPTSQPTEKASDKEISYTIISEEDISYLGCKRTAVKVQIPDGTEQNDMNELAQDLINERKSSWEDITIWLYFQSTTSSFADETKTYSNCD